MKNLKLLRRNASQQLFLLLIHFLKSLITAGGCLPPVVSGGKLLLTKLSWEGMKR